MRRTALFDLDGTLVDSLPDLAASLNRVLAPAGLAPFEPSAIRPMVGDGVVRLVERALAARGKSPDPAILDAFQTDYFAHVALLSHPFPGVPEMLARLAAEGWQMAICTNKPEAAARKLLARLELLSRFGAIGGGDSFPVRKPDPAHLRATLRAAGGDAARAVMVGDHANDMKAAAGAGIPGIFASWGYGPRAMAGGAPIAAQVSDLPDLLEAALRAKEPTRDAAASGEMA